MNRSPSLESMPLLIKGCLGSSRADVASKFEEYACPNIVTRRPPFHVPLLMTARFQRTPPARLGLHDCHLRDLLLPLCCSAPCPLCLALFRFFLDRVFGLTIGTPFSCKLHVIRHCLA